MKNEKEKKPPQNKKEGPEEIKKGKGRATENQRQVVKKTLEKVGKGEKVIKSQILKEVGYKKSIQKNPHKIFESKGVQNVLRPVIEEMEELRRKTITALKFKNLRNEKVSELSNLLKGLNHDIELLGGRPTERSEIIDIDKNELADYIKSRKKREND
jgi:hypothetical protein